MDMEWVLKNKCRDKSYRVNKSPFRIGRHKEHEIVCCNSIISREHATFLLESNKLYIKDLESANGTFLNGRKLLPLEKKHISNSDIISLGQPTHTVPCVASECHFYDAYSEPNINSTLDVIRCLAESENEIVNAKNTPTPPAEHIVASNNDNKIVDNVGQVLKPGEEMEWHRGDMLNSNEEVNLHENLNIEIKKEPEPQLPQNIGYSIEDNVIVINDDDDFNNELSASQLFPSNDLFRQIKEELEEIDYCSQRLPVIIDSDDDDPSLDLLSILSPEPVTNLNINTDLLGAANKRDISKTDVNGENILKCNNVFQKGTSSKFIDNNAERSSTETREQNESSNSNHRNNNISASSSNFNNKTAAEKKASIFEPSTSKYLKPPIIEAPVLTKSAIPKSKSKRKSTSNDSKNESKMPKLSDETDQKATTSRRSKKSSNAKKENFSKEKEDKLEIKQKRKDKLKQISIPTKNAESPKGSFKFSKPCVKQSKSRGTFMLDDAPASGTMKKRYDVISNHNSKVAAPNMQIASSSNQCTNKRSTQIDPRNGDKSKLTVPVTGYANNKASTSTAPVVYMALKPNGTQPRQGLRVNQNISFHSKSLFEKPTFNDVLNILNWRSSWLVEQKGLPMPPPVNKKSPVKMCNSFSNHRDYCNVVIPLLVLELWNEVYQDWVTITLERQAERKFNCAIMDVNATPTYFILKCVALLTREQSLLKQHLKEYNIVLLHVLMKGINCGYQQLFGFVTSIEKRPINGSDLLDGYLTSQLKPLRAEYLLHFDVVIKPTANITNWQKYIEGAILLSLVPLMREFDAVYSLATSPLCKDILDPQVSNYRNHLSSTLNSTEYKVGNLNEVQQKVVSEASTLCLNDRPGIYLVQGPPGTGKTTVIKHIVRNVILNNLGKRTRLLLTAPSNSAVDGLVLKIVNELKCTLTDDEKKQIKLVRIGRQCAANEDVKGYLLDSFTKTEVTRKLRENPAVDRDYNNLVYKRKMCKAKIEKQKATSIPSKKLKQLNEKFAQLDLEFESFPQKYFGQAYQLEFFSARKRVLDGSNIICSTLSSCVRLQEMRGIAMSDFTCIVDEATQSKESETLIPLMLGINKLILIGDPLQLPAVTISKYAKELEHGQSLFARIAKNFNDSGENPIRMLKVQHRMHPAISLFPNNTFYKGKLENSDICVARQEDLDKILPYYVFDINLQNKGSRQHNINAEEIECVATLLSAIDEILDSSKLQIGVITPYNSQKEALFAKFGEKNCYRNLVVTINTIDSFQGLEKDIIIISCVRHSPNAFLGDEQRINVALTRAKYALYVVGTYPIFEKCPLLKLLKVDAVGRNLYSTINSFSTNSLGKLIKSSVLKQTTIVSQ